MLLREREVLDTPFVAGVFFDTDLRPSLALGLRGF